MIESSAAKSEKQPEQEKQGIPPALPAVKTSNLAVASAACSYLGFFICLFIGPILGIYFGYRALIQIKSSGGTLGGETLARSGITAGWTGAAVHVVLLFLIVLFASGVFHSIIPWLH